MAGDFQVCSIRKPRIIYFNCTCLGGFANLHLSPDNRTFLNQRYDIIKNLISQWLNHSDKLKLLLIVSALFPLLFLVAYVRENAYNIPFWDQWDSSLSIALKTGDGTLTLDDLIHQHNEHRILYTNLLTAFLTQTTHWDTRFEMGVSVVIATCNLALLYVIFYHHHPKLFPYIALPFALITFSLIQYENWLWGFQTQWFFANFFVLATIATLDIGRIGWRTLIIAAVLSFAGTFAIGYGVLAWFCGLLMMGMCGYRRYGYYAVWCVLAGLAIYLYYTNGYETPAPLGEETGHDPINIIRFMTMYVMGGFAPPKATFINFFGFIIILIGSLLLPINMRYIWRRTHTLRPIAAWITLVFLWVGPDLVRPCNAPKCLFR